MEEIEILTSFDTQHPQVAQRRSFNSDCMTDIPHREREGQDCDFSGRSTKERWTVLQRRSFSDSVGSNFTAELRSRRIAPGSDRVPRWPGSDPGRDGVSKYLFYFFLFLHLCCQIHYLGDIHLFNWQRIVMTSVFLIFFQCQSRQNVMWDVCHLKRSMMLLFQSL